MSVAKFFTLLVAAVILPLAPAHAQTETADQGDRAVAANQGDGFRSREADPPFVLPASVTMLKDVRYATADGQDLHVDLFLPKTGRGPFPAIVYVHGGLGSSPEAKAQWHRQAAYMATRGFVGAVVQYRRLPEARYPAAVHDLKAAVRWLRANAAKYRVDASRIGAAGGSGGGNIVGMLGTTNGDAAYEGTVGGNLAFSSRVSAVAAFNPVMDWTGFSGRSGPMMTNVVGPYLGVAFADRPEVWRDASPINHVGPKTVPFLFLTGDLDHLYPQTVAMADKLRAAGVRAEVYTAQGARHGFYNRPPWFDPTLKRMEAFFTAEFRGERVKAVGGK